MNSPSIPTLTTERLRLRAPVADDFPAYQRFMASPRAHYLGGPYDVRGAWFCFCHDVAGWTLFGHGAVMVDLRATGECIGQVCLNHGPLFEQKELGWLLYENFEARGYATEAAAALREWAWRSLKLTELVSYLDPDNAASIRVALRLGARLDPDGRAHDPTQLVYRHPPAPHL